mgnify:CR=1 FL=1
MKKWTNILIYGSFVFLVIYLAKQDYFVPELISPFYLITATLLLFAGFLVSTYSWKTALQVNDIQISLRQAIRSHGMSVFTKYIPGKLWVILGRAASISQNKKELTKNSIISLQEQLIYLWTGFMISLIPSLFILEESWIIYSLLTALIGLSLFLFVPAIHRLISSMATKLTKKELEIPRVDIKKSWPVILSTSAIWLFWSTSFYFFGKAFSNDFTWSMTFAFPLSVSLGLLAIFLPGGIGLREGVITTFLHSIGLDIAIATSISISHRLLFVSGEVFIFCCALINKKKKD